MKSNRGPDPRRRRLLTGLGVTSIGMFAGCLGSDDEENGQEGDRTDGETTDWRSATLTDSTTGEEFRIDQFEETTIVHTFASNCLTCAAQQDEFVTLWDRRDDIEIVELSIDSNDTSEDIANHAADSGLEWRVGVSPEAVTGSLVEEFGQTVTVSAQSPIIIVCPDGNAETVSKIADPDELEAAIADAC